MNEFYEEIDCENTEEIVCPWCACILSDSWESHLNEDTWIEECSECGKSYKAERDVKVTYNTERIDD